MALVESTTVKLGTPMPAFELEDAQGKKHPSDSLYGPKGLLVVFTCNHCPYAVAVWPRLIRLARSAETLGVRAAAINPNIHPAYPEDAPERMKEKIKEWGVFFPYLVDAAQTTARDFKAQCTPDLYLYDAGKKLVYHGRIDDNWQDESKVRRRELQETIEALASGKPVPGDQRPSMGCSIKWR